MMNTIEYFKDKFTRFESGYSNGLATIRRDAFRIFSEKGIPGSRHEEWKYTRIASLFNREYQFPVTDPVQLNHDDIARFRLPGHEKANELFFVNGLFSSKLSSIRSKNLVVVPLEEAAGKGYEEIIKKHLGHSSAYMKDGINALNMAFMESGLFIMIEKGRIAEHPIYIYNITDARSMNIFSQPRSLVYLDRNSVLQIVETFITVGSQESFTNQVMEIVVEEDALAEYYKIEDDAAGTNLLSTTHIRQVGKSYTHAVTISLNGGIVRNNLNVILEADHCESHLYGLYFQNGKTHVDNHTVVDNLRPGCYSNELYKGILDENATGVFNGKIFVRQLAQKTNAYQSNKNILLSDSSSVNTKPQLEIFADDVKCSHGCTVGRLDDEGLFYLRSRGVPEKIAKSLLLHGFAIDILDKIKLDAIRDYADRRISERLELI